MLSNGNYYEQNVVNMSNNYMINIAQLGVGYWGPNLLRNFVSNKNCIVKTVVDLSQDRRDFVKGLYPAVEISDTAEYVFNDHEIDAVVIATPVNTHFNLTIRALSGWEKS